MPGFAGPWFRAARSMWYTTTPEGKQVPLGVTDPAGREAAEAAQARLVEQLAAAVAAKITTPTPSPPPPAAAARTVRQAVDEFLAAAEKKVARGKLKEKTLAGYRGSLARFVAQFGPHAVGALEAEAIEEWAARPGWSASTQNTYLGDVQTLLKFCKVRLAIARPPKESRGADTCLTDEQFAAVLKEACRYSGAKGDLRELLRTLRETGGRPGEVSGLTAESVDWPLACTRQREHKTRRHTGADRVIHFNAAAMAILTAQRAKYGEGLLFRTRAGGRYTAPAIVRRLGQVSDRVGFRVIAYGLGRHSFATRALERGVPDAVVAELLGHRGTAMLGRHYSHLGQRAQILKDAAERASGTPPKAAG